jgi:hypothetical protein
MKGGFGHLHFGDLHLLLPERIWQGDLDAINRAISFEGGVFERTGIANRDKVTKYAYDGW